VNTTMETVTSADGTRIALERTGAGLPVILVGGAFNDRSTVAALAAALAPEMTAITYDRRGQGDSGNNDQAFDVDREFDDLAAVIDHAGGAARVFGHSSGAVLAVRALVRGLPIERLAVYEPSYMPAGTRTRPGPDLYERLVRLITHGRRDEAVTLFQTEAVGLPAEMVDGMRATDFWGWFTGLAHTLPYDVAVNRDYLPPPGSRQLRCRSWRSTAASHPAGSVRAPALLPMPSRARVTSRSRARTMASCTTPGRSNRR
jgi:hypothetical protein